MTKFIAALNLYKSSVEEQILSSNPDDDLRELLTDIPNWNETDLSKILSFYKPDLRRKVVRYKLLDRYIADFPIIKIQRAFRRHLGAYERTLIRAFKRTFPNVPYLEAKDIAGKIIQSFMENGHYVDKEDKVTREICEKRVVNDVRIQGKEIVCITDNSDREQRKRVVTINMLLPDKEGRAKIFYFSVRIEFSWNEKRGVVIDRRCVPIPNFSITRIQRAFRRHLKSYDTVLTDNLKSLFPNSPEAIITQIASKIIKSFMGNGHYGNQVICRAREVRDLSIDKERIVCVIDNNNRKERTRIVSITVLLPPVNGGFKVFYFSARIEYSWNNKNESVVDSEKGLLEVKPDIKLGEIEDEISGAIIQKSLADERPDLICKAPELIFNKGKRVIFEIERCKEFFEEMPGSYQWLFLEMVRVIQGIIFIHSKGFVHRDIKPNNLFRNKNNQVLIGDFGLCRKENSRCEAAGTAFYVPEECCHNYTKIIKGQDSFAFVITLAQILFGTKLNNFLENPVRLRRHTRNYLLAIIENRKLFATNASYSDINNTVYQSLLMDTLRRNLIGYVDTHISDDLKDHINDIIKQSVEVRPLIDEILSSDIPEEHKKECVIIIKLFEASFKLLVDAVQGDIKNNHITSEKILGSLLSIAS